MCAYEYTCARMSAVHVCMVYMRVCMQYKDVHVCTCVPMQIPKKGTRVLLYHSSSRSPDTGSLPEAETNSRDSLSLPSPPQCRGGRQGSLHPAFFFFFNLHSRDLKSGSQACAANVLTC